MQLEIDDYENKLLYDMIGDYIGIEKKFNAELIQGNYADNAIPIQESNKRLYILATLRARL